MLNKDKSSIYFLEGDSYGIMDRLIGFLSEDVNFLFLDTTNTKEVNKRTVNHKYIENDTDIVGVIDGNKRNLDHIILYIPYVYKVHYIPKVKELLDNMSVPYSIITDGFNRDNSPRSFDNIYIVKKKEIIKNDEVITYDSFTTQYIRLARINDIINNSD